MKSSENAYDDLTVIGGIGAVRQRWLRESLHVHTYKDLAALTADEIETQLKADGRQIPPQGVIEKWLVRAHELAANDDEPLAVEVEPGDDKAVGEANLLTREDGWKPLASFVIEFQARELDGQAEECRTAVHHMEADNGTIWPGVESDLLCPWILDQIRDDPRLGPPKHGDAKASPRKELSVKIRILEVRVFQPSGSDTAIHTVGAGVGFEGSVKGNEPLRFEVDFELTGPAASKAAAKQITCIAQCYAYSKANKTSVHLGDSEPVCCEEKRFDYTLALPEITLQEGDYRLWILVTHGGALATPDFVEFLAFRAV